MTKSINWAGVAAALIFGQILSFLWYGLLFGPRLHGLMAAGARTPIGRTEGVGLQLVMIIGLNLILKRMNARGYAGGAACGAILWFFLPFIGEVMNVLYMGEGWPLFLANSGYTLIFLTVAGALVSGLKLGRGAAAA